MIKTPVPLALICATGLGLLTPGVSYSASITGTGPYSGPPGFDRGLGSTMHCGNNPESWVRSSAMLDTESGQLNIVVQLETDSTLAGPKGKAVVNLQNARGATLLTVVSDEVGMGGKPPGNAAIRNFTKLVQIPEAISRAATSLLVTAQCEGSTNQLWGIDAGDVIRSVKLGLTALGGLRLQGGPPTTPDDITTALQRQAAAVAGGGGATALLRDSAGSLVQQDPRYQENARLLLGLGTGGRQNRDRIWGGLPTAGYRKVVAVRVKGDLLCTGVVISSSTVLTAAHCVCPGVDAVDEVNGDLNHLAVRHLLAANQPSKPTMRSCDAPTSIPADVGLIQISDIFPPDNPIVLASTLAINGAPFIRAVGFGENENGDAGTKEYVDIPVASSNCGGVVKSHPDGTWYGCTPTFELVAGQSHLNRDTCHGDSGGPIFLHIDDGAGSYKEYLAGITSRGITRPDARDCGDGGIYTRVDSEVIEYIRGQGVTIQMQGQ